MSTTTRKISVYFFVCALFLLSNSRGAAQPFFEANIKIEAAQSKFVNISGNFLSAGSTAQDKHWSFLNNAAAENSVERIANLVLTGKNGQTISVKKFSGDEYVADGEAAFWTYRIETNNSQNVNAMAHASWLDAGRGILMLEDLLPQFSASADQPISARIKFDLPSGWKIFSREKELAENVFEVENIEKAVFLVGKDWRRRQISFDGGKLSFITSGDWQFSDDEAEKIAVDILAEYRKMFEEMPDKNVQISLVHFPKEVKFGRWQAETRGANLTVLSSDMPFKTLALQRLHEQLRHELFHLWMPNNLALTGNYDWFYEGFTVYQALKTGVVMNQIRFEDFLDTLAQAYNLDRFQDQKNSLLETSKNFRSGAGSPQVYARGMIVAFLCDAALLRQSSGKKSISTVFGQIYKKHRKPAAAQNGNAAVLNVLDEYRELNRIVEKYVKGTGQIDWKTDLESAGIEQSEENGFLRLRVKEKPTGRQKDLLNNLGYNNWRKISVKTK